MSSELLGARPDPKIGFIQTTLDPVHYDILPPNIVNRTSFAKRFTLDASWPVRDVAAKDGSGNYLFPGEQISEQSGLVMWLPNRGLDSLYRMGVVPALTNSPDNGGPETAANFHFFYPYEVALPYAKDGTHQFTVSPDPASDFSFTRMVGGIVQLSSNAIAIGQTVITGLIAGGAIADTRDVCQDPKTGQAYSPSNLMQQSITSKDCFQNVDFEKGITMLLGSDIPIGFSPPQRDLYRTIQGGLYTAQIIPQNSGSINLTIFAQPSDGPKFTPVTRRFISPLGVQMVNFTQDLQPGHEYYNVTQTAFALPPDNIKIDPINTHGGIEYDIASFVSGTISQSSAHHNAQVLVRITVSDVHAKIGSNANIVYDYSQPWEYDHLIDVNSLRTDNLYTWRQNHKYLVQPKKPSERGTYIGSTITWYMKLIGTTPATDPTPADFTMSLMMPFAYAGFTAPDLYADGELGTARIGRFDGVGIGQQVKAKGCLVVECVPEGNIAPYVTSSDKLALKTSSVNLFPFVSTLYNGYSGFKRIWVTEEYERVIRGLSTLNMDTLLQFANQTGADEVTHAAEAAGLFGNLGSLGGQMTGGILGENPIAAQMGGMLGGMAGNALDSLFGSAGQFGAPQFGSAGQFGAPQFGARGQYGASGEFGSAKRNRSNY